MKSDFAVNVYLIAPTETLKIFEIVSVKGRKIALHKTLCTKMINACADQNDMRTRRLKLCPHAQTKIMPARADQNYMRTRRPKVMHTRRPNYMHTRKLKLSKIICAHADQKYMRTRRAKSCARSPKSYAYAQTKLYAHAHTKIICACAFHFKVRILCGVRISIQSQSLTENQTTKFKSMLNFVIAAESAFWRSTYLKFNKNIFSIGYDTVLWKYKFDFK